MLNKKRDYIYKETLLLHKRLKATRLASSLSMIEILVALFYSSKYDFVSQKDKLIISKAHGAISMYPILADLGLIEQKQLLEFGNEGSILGSIPDSNLPLFNTDNGSLGLGLSVACGKAIAYKRQGVDSRVVVIVGDGELNEGSIWESVMFASFHKLDNILVIVDNNKKSMLDYQKNIMGLEAIEKKFEVFGWNTKRCDGHNIDGVSNSIESFYGLNNKKPSVIVADTIKGYGIEKFEKSPICHVLMLNDDEIDEIINRMESGI